MNVILLNGLILSFLRFPTVNLFHPKVDRLIRSEPEQTVKNYQATHWLTHKHYLKIAKNLLYYITMSKKTCDNYTAALQTIIFKQADFIDLCD